MTRRSFGIPGGRTVPAVTASEMREIDRIAVEDVGLQLLQMMENAGRTLAWHVRDARDEGSTVVVVAGNGGNGGGGMACARHLANRDVPVHIALDRSAENLTGVAAHQYRILDAMAVPTTSKTDRLSRFEESAVVVDALIGYGLSGELRSPANRCIERMNRHPGETVSLDVPSGLDATTGEPNGVAAQPDRTVTLALPKTGLDTNAGQLYLADIGIPTVVYDRQGIDYCTPFGNRDWVELQP